jgi:hypothetical protein
MEGGAFLSSTSELCVSAVSEYLTNIFYIS